MKEDSNARDKIVKDSGHYVGSSIIGQVFGLLRALLMPVFFNPAQLGVWNFLNLILSYCPHAQLGLMHGLNKSIPMTKGLGDVEEEKKIQNSIFWSNLILSALAMFVLFSSSWFVSAAYVIPLRLLSVIVFFQMLYYYYFSLLRANSKFVWVSNGIFFTSVLSTVLVLLMVNIFSDPVIGALIGLGLSGIAVLGYWVLKGKYAFQPQISFVTLKKSFFLGIPILGIGILESLTVSIDRIFIASSMSAAQLGYYALGIMLSGMVSLIPGSVASVLYTSMLERFSVNKDPKDASGLLLTPIRMIWALIAVLITGVFIILPVVIRLFLPKYIPSIPIIEILIWGAFFMSCSHIPGMFLIAINKQNLIIAIQSCSILLVFLTDAILTHFNFGIIGIATGTTIGYVIYGVGYTALALSNVLQKRSEILKYLFWQSFPVLSLGIMFVILEKMNLFQYSYQNFWMVIIVKFILLLLLLGSLLWFVNRDGILIILIKKEVKKIYHSKLARKTK